MDILKYKINIDYLINNVVVEVRSEGEEESVFIVERTESQQTKWSLIATSRHLSFEAHPSSSTIACNVDQPPANENQANAKPEESATRSESKKKNTKEKSHTETNGKSKADNNVDKQRETEKKSESNSRTIRKEQYGKKNQNKSQRVVTLGDSMIKKVKGW